VYWSAALVALVPPGVVTVTLTVPIPAGAVAVMVVELVMVKLAATVPNFTPVAPVKPVPVMVTRAVPVLTPEIGLRALTAGTGGWV
jgi:hypothetical protein